MIPAKARQSPPDALIANRQFTLLGEVVGAGATVSAVLSHVLLVADQTGANVATCQHAIDLLLFGGQVLISDRPAARPRAFADFAQY